MGPSRPLITNGHPGCEQLVKISKKLTVFQPYLNKMSSGSTFILSRMILIHALWYLATKNVIFYLSLVPYAFFENLCNIDLERFEGKLSTVITH